MGMEKPKTGLLLIGCERFRKLGEGCGNGNYETRKENFAKDFISKFNGVADVAFSGIVYSRADVDNAIEFFRAERVDCVICTFLSWSEDRAWIAFLRDMFDVPLMLYLPEVPDALLENTRDEDDFIEFLARGGLVGSLEGSGSIARCGRNIEVVVDDFESALPRFTAFTRAAKAKAKLRKAKFGLLANYNEIMWSTYIDPYRMFTEIGPELTFISYARLKEATETISNQEAEAYRHELSQLYPVEDDVDAQLFLESARASLGLAKLREKMDLDALVLNDVDHELFETIGLRPGFYPLSFNEHNAILTPEGDLGAGTIIYALKQMTGKNISFVEPFYLDKASDTFSAGHAGPHDYTNKKHKDMVRISRDVRFAKTSYKYAGAPFAWYRIPPGNYTLAHFSQGKDSFRIVCFMAESLPGKHGLCSYSHTDFKTTTPVTGLFEKIISTGTTQHFAALEGDFTSELELFANINNFEFSKF